MFASTSSTDLPSGAGLHLAWSPDVRVFFDARAAQSALSRFRSRAVALQIALLYSDHEKPYPEDTPSAVERRLVELKLVPSKDDSRLLARMARRGMPRVPLVHPWRSPNVETTDASAAMGELVAALPRYIRYQFGKVIRKHEEFLDLLTDPVWRLLDPRPITAALLADFAAGAMERGVDGALLCRTDSVLSEADRYRWLLQTALSSNLGQPLALRCALIELRFAELIGDLARYETCLRAIPDIVSRGVENDALFDALTGVPCGGTRRGLGGSWLLADKQEDKIMHLQEYVVATFSRVTLSQCAIDHAEEYDDILRTQGLELDGPPRFMGPLGREDMVFCEKRPKHLRPERKPPRAMGSPRTIEVHEPPKPAALGMAPRTSESPDWRSRQC